MDPVFTVHDNTRSKTKEESPKDESTVPAEPTSQGVKDLNAELETTEALTLHAVLNHWLAHNSTDDVATSQKMQQMVTELKYGTDETLLFADFERPEIIYKQRSQVDSDFQCNWISQHVMSHEMAKMCALLQKRGKD